MSGINKEVQRMSHEEFQQTSLYTNDCLSLYCVLQEDEQFPNLIPVNGKVCSDFVVLLHLLFRFT